MISPARVKENTPRNIRIIRRFRRFDGYDGEPGLSLQEELIRVETITVLRH